MRNAGASAPLCASVAMSIHQLDEGCTCGQGLSGSGLRRYLRVDVLKCQNAQLDRQSQLEDLRHHARFMKIIAQSPLKRSNIYVITQIGGADALAVLGSSGSHSKDLANVACNTRQLVFQAAHLHR